MLGDRPQPHKSKRKLHKRKLLWRSWIHCKTGTRKASTCWETLTLSTRLGDIYSLRRLAEEVTDTFHLQVMELLWAFLTGRQATFAGFQCPKGNRGKMCRPLWTLSSTAEYRGIEIQEVTKTGTDRSRWLCINLKGTDLEGAWLPDARLHDAILDGVCPAGAWAPDRTCRTQSLTDGKLHRGAVFNGANFDHATMTGAEMSK